MARLFSLFFIVLVSISCSNTISDENLKHLTGYWEIEEVILPDGTNKEYKINPTIDYFELKGKTGFRKKVMPQFDGSYRVNDLSEKISVIEEEGTNYISYVTDYAKWKEEIVELNDKELVLRNNHGMEYRYKKPEPFSVK